MSGSLARPLLGFLTERSPQLRPCPWHVLCMVLLPGCLYVEPIWRPVVNAPPEIIRPEAYLGDDIAIDLSITSGMTVVVVEPDGDDVDIVWLQPPPSLLYEENATAEDGTFTSSITVLNREDASLNGKRFECDVIDEAIPANVQTISFEFITGVQ